VRRDEEGRCGEMWGDVGREGREEGEREEGEEGRGNREKLKFE
jgi:hypothetical protein